ncbi:hypothetical protein AX17_002980 [Amanita inopinata Kibby_2008]|nr:hypothetical protein AX17_002980 [Amanita inopinata Kibby_2008]
MTDPNQPPPPHPPPSTSRSLLLPEALGFSPQLLLDDIINIANNAVQDGVNGMEEFLQNWTDKRISRSPETEVESIQEVEQGLVAFQTLLEYHTDIAFDFFEAWSLRNIFAVPQELEVEVVLPHHEGLDLTVGGVEGERREKELMDEIDELRQKLDNQRHLKRTLTRALRTSSSKRKRASQRLEDLSSLLSLSSSLSRVPQKLGEMYEAVSSLPPLEPAVVASLSHGPEPEAGKRPWETSKMGYVSWAVGRLLERAKQQGVAAAATGGGGIGVGREEEVVAMMDEVAKLRAGVEAVAKADALKTALESFEVEKRGERSEAMLG